MSKRRLILVTGAPRTATTPVGNMLARCNGALSIYEPLGPTGLARIGTPFPIVGAGLGIEQDQLAALVDDLRALRVGRLKAQVRGVRPARLSARIFGSRTLHSLRLARLQPWSRTIIWKDPHAIFLVPDLMEQELDIVVTARTPWAHAASYKRLGWTSKAAQVYPRWSVRYGRCAICERFLGRASHSVVSAALLWRLSYLCLIRTGAIGRVHLITSDDLAKDESGTYLSLMRLLRLVPSPAVERELSKSAGRGRADQLSRKVHDWGRSVESVNSYWKDVLTPEELEQVHELTCDITPQLFRTSAQPPDGEGAIVPKRYDLPKGLEVFR